MENIGALANISDAIEQFSKKAERVEKSKNIFGIYWCLFWLCRDSRKLIKEFRALMSLCGQLCSDAGCMQKFYPKIKKIRNDYAAIYAMVLKTWFLAPLRYLLDRTLDEWDDLAEDTAIAADPEIRGLINQIADAL